MPLNAAVLMDPIERINIRGDSTFALLLEAGRRGHAMSYFTPDRMAMALAKLNRQISLSHSTKSNASDKIIE